MGKRQGPGEGSIFSTTSLKAPMRKRFRAAYRMARIGYWDSPVFKDRKMRDVVESIAASLLGTRLAETNEQDVERRAELYRLLQSNDKDDRESAMTWILRESLDK